MRTNHQGVTYGTGDGPKSSRYDDAFTTNVDRFDLRSVTITINNKAERLYTAVTRIPFLFVGLLADSC